MNFPWRRSLAGAGLVVAAVSIALGLWPRRSSHEALDLPPIPTLGRYSQAAGHWGSLDDGIAGVTVSPAGEVIPAAIHHWATAVVSYRPAPGVQRPWNHPQNALGPISGDPTHIVSLGDLDRAQIRQGVPPGAITLEIGSGIRNGPGPDFAVFENGFLKQNGIFAELAYVEVSSDGVHFARFSSEFLHPHPVGPGDPLDPTAIYNLAGKHTNNIYINADGFAEGQSWGTPFDLETLRFHPHVAAGILDLDRVRFVRIIDIPGTGDFRDSQGNPIYDPWPTANSGSGGFDLAGVGVLHPMLGFESFAQSQSDRDP